MRKNIILLDTVPELNWWFKKELEFKTQKEFVVISSDIHNLQGSISKILRYIFYFSISLKIVLCRKKYKDIVSWQQFFGLCYTFWMRLFHLKKINKLIVMTFIYKKKKGLIGQVFDKFMRYIVSSEYIDKFICFSEYECKEYTEYFNIDKEKFVSCGLTLDDKYDQYKDIIVNGNYYLSVGRSNRNYQYLCDEFRNLKQEVFVLCDGFKINDAPGNIRFLNNVYGNEYLKLLAQCKGVIIPLNSDGISAGQLTLIQGMMFGKICIITRTATSIEYAENGKNAILMDNKKNELVQIVTDIEQGGYLELGKQSRQEYLKKYTGIEMATAVANAIKG